jgi:hypothetical protein
MGRVSQLKRVSFDELSHDGNGKWYVVKNPGETHAYSGRAFSSRGAPRHFELYVDNGCDDGYHEVRVNGLKRPITRESLIYEFVPQLNTAELGASERGLLKIRNL